MKVKLNIKQPLRRGQMVQVGEDGRERWCPFEYEFLPAFCWTCGFIGHVYKTCNTVLKKGEEQQYGSWLKYKPTQKKSFEEDGRFGGSQRKNDGRSYGFGNGSKSGSESLSWRKDSTDTENQRSKTGEDREVTSPLKLTNEMMRLRMSR
jgi:hypothetical protein